MEVLGSLSGLQYEGFKRFMTERDMPYPLAFWSDMQKFRALPIGAVRLNMMKQIFRTYFSKNAKQGRFCMITATLNFMLNKTAFLSAGMVMI